MFTHPASSIDHILPFTDGSRARRPQDSLGRTLGLLALAWAPLACGGDGVTELEGSGPVASLAVQPDSIVVAAGATVRLNAIVKDAAGRSLSNRRIRWSSADSAVAVVDSTGTVTPTGLGAARITATAEDVSATATVAVSNAARFVSQSVPQNMAPGERARVTVRMRNTGTTTWTRAGGYKLGTDNPRDNTTWTGGTRVYLDPGDAIAPGQEKTFSFQITAPSQPQTENFQWRMVHEGVEWFGERTENVAITVEQPASANAARFVRQTVPSTMGPGARAQVSITMKNTGTTTWTRDAGYKLGTVNPRDNTIWTGRTRVWMPPGVAVAPGQEITFGFEITAPAQPGEEQFQWRMVQEGVEWFGARTTNVAIAIEAPALANDAGFVRQSVPSQLSVGQRRAVSVTMRNNGTTTWTRAAGYKLGTQNPQDNTTWTGTTRVYMPQGVAVAPGQEMTFNFEITAPLQPGEKQFQWQMLQEGVAWFGAKTTNVAIAVEASASANDARFIEQSAPSRIAVGERRRVSITMLNTGTTTWTRDGGYKLGTENPKDNRTWTGTPRVYMPPGAAVAPGQEITFAFDITGPSQPGVEPFQWQMVQEGVEWFGELTTSIDITIVRLAGGGNCTDANPDDDVPDDGALQACLDGGGTVRLVPGSPGYIIRDGLELSTNGTVLTSAEAPAKVRLLAHPDLFAPLLNVLNKADFVLEYVIFDGNKNGRTQLARCDDGFGVVRRNGSNIIIGGGARFAIRHVEANNAMCGSSLQINGTDFEVAHSVIANNGFSRAQQPNVVAPWSDGITLGRCDGGYVHHNSVRENTDVAIISGGGHNCRIEDNTIVQMGTQAFAGLAVHFFDAETDGTHTGSVYQRNHITAGLSRLDFGISVGMHPWFPNLLTRGGAVLDNVVSGAVVNLAVDGYADGTVMGNQLDNPQGDFSHNVNCRGFQANHTVGHATNVDMQDGWVAKTFDQGQICGSWLHVGLDRWVAEDFETLAPGALPGQNGWTRPGAASASPEVVRSIRGGQLLRVDPPAGGVVGAGKDAPDQHGGRHVFEFDVFVTGAGEPSLAKIELRTNAGGGWDKKAQLYFGSSMRINYSPGGAAIPFVPTTELDRWYHVGLDIDLDAGTADVYVDDELVAPRVPLHPGPLTGLAVWGWDRDGAVFLDNLRGGGY